LDHGAEENEAILIEARRLAPSETNLFVLACWEFFGSEFEFEHMDEGLVEQTKEEVDELFSKMFQKLLEKYDLRGLGDRAHLINENPVSAIPQFCENNNIDVAVMCSASLNHPLGRKLGSTIERTIASLPCALLTVKPIGFANNQTDLTQKETQLA
jgi:nucleotide-binding universal stress UspA family protein